MKPGINSISFVVLISLIVVSWIFRAASSLPVDPFLGIPPEDVNYYKSSSDFISCKDGSKKFTKSQLNDDFCDCPDGTDEPGTSACPNGKFYCRNAGHAPLTIFSSRVNDGICDCCDGTDEYDGHVKCPNTCWEAGKVARDRLKKKITTYQEGAAIRKKEIEQAISAVAKDEAELSKLKSEEKILNGLVQQLKERKEQIEKAEEDERLKKEKEKEKEEAEKKANQEQVVAEEEGNSEKTDHDDKVGIAEDDYSDQDVVEEEKSHPSESEEPAPGEAEKVAEGEKEEVITRESEEASVIESETGHDASDKESLGQETKDKDDSTSAESLSKEELGRLVASRWTGESTEKQTGEGVAAEDNHKGHEEPLDLPDHDGYASESDDESLKYDDKNEEIEDGVEEDFKEEDQDDSSSSYTSDAEEEPDLSDLQSDSNPSWLEKIQRKVQNILQHVKLFRKPVDISEGAQVRKEYDESNAKLSKIQSRISSLTKKLKHDFGPEKVFYSFYGRCFESKQNKYMYKVCPYKHATQEEGYSTSRLGEWDKFEDSYSIMVFSNGDRCWNGPDRSMKVRLRCGLKNEVTDVDEPSRCEYVALLSTPAVCYEEKLKELQNKLEAMNKNQPVGHDEL